MKYRNLGSTGVSVSEICFGGGGDDETLAQKDELELIDYVYHAGINLFDTAPLCGLGQSEQRLGKALSLIREKVYLVSKSGVTWNHQKKITTSNDPALTEKMLHQSLRDLKTDYIDFYMIHWPDEKIDIRYTLEILKRAQEQQKIRWIGLCNTNLADLEKAKDVCRIEVVQSQFNLFEQKPIEDLFPYLKKEQIGFMSCWKEEDVLKKLEQDKKWRPQIEERGHTLLEWALGFNLGFKEVSSAICGVKVMNQLDGLLHAIERRPIENKEYFKLS